MTLRARVSRYVLAAGMFALPVVLLVNGVLTAREIRDMKLIYMRNRAGAIAARLETLPPGETVESQFDKLAEEEPGLMDLRIFDRNQDAAGNSALNALWSGRELFQTDELTTGGEKIFRAYVPFHSPAGLRVAQIDISANAADFLLGQARHNLLVAVTAGLALWGVALYAVWTARRLSRLERQRLQLEQLAQMGRLSAVLAHEIRNPLGTIKGFAQLAAEKADSSAAALLAPVLQEVMRLETLVRDLLLFGRPREPVMALVEWPVLAGELASYAGEIAPGADVRFVTGGEAWRFETDPDLLKQVLLNLVRSSVEALQAVGGGEVRLCASIGARGGLVITVADDGPGIPDEVTTKLFEPFVTTKASGTGLGLSIAARLVQSLGGKLEIHPNRPHGTCADIILPRVKPVAMRGGAVWKLS